MHELADIGVIGLGVMGKNLALNIEENGHSVALYDAVPEKASEIQIEAPDARLIPSPDLESFVRVLRRPRRVLIMVPAGKPVDLTLDNLESHLESDDVVLDGGNEHYRETERRQRAWAETGIHLIGMGVSGGQEGARLGPSLMPGGPEAAYRVVEPILTKIAAQVADGPCVTYLGPGGSGHFVKMVHNGIEYADMQLIAEVYDFLRYGAGLEPDLLAAVFAEWNRGPLEGFLVEITAEILRKSDDRGGQGPLIDMILDTARMKGTGSWTVEAGAELAAPIPTLAGAVEARLMSGLRDLRLQAKGVLQGPVPNGGAVGARAELVADAGAALYAAKICAYAQGLGLLQEASRVRGWNLNLSEIARIWKAGCIIRARLLGQIQAAYAEQPKLRHLLLDAGLAKELEAAQDGWRRTLSRCIEHGIAAPALASSLAFYDGLRRERSPAHLTQAQRDVFGAHTYQRLDREGHFHTDWSR